MKERKKQPECEERSQLNSRVSDSVRRKLRLVVASRKSAEWTQDAIVDAALRLILGCKSKDTERMANEVMEASKEIQGSFNAPEHQLAGFAV